MTYTQVWYVNGIVSSSPTNFYSVKIGLISDLYLKWLILKCATSLELSAQALLISTQKIGLSRVTYDPPVKIRVNKYLKWLLFKCATSLESSAQALLISTQKIGLIRVTNYINYNVNFKKWKVLRKGLKIIKTSLHTFMKCFSIELWLSFSDNAGIE